MIEVLHKKELQEISGAKQRRRLVDWLNELRVPFIYDANGWPIVERSALFPKTEVNKREPKINFS